MHRMVVAALLISASATALAQDTQRRVTLEAAAIKPAAPGAPTVVPGNWAPPTNSSAHLRPMTLRTLVMYAFDLQPRRHDPEPVGGPAWIDKNAYELTLKFSDLPTIPQAQNLIRALLEERFGLRWRVEKRETPIYALVLARPDGKLGTALKRSTVDCGAYSETLARTGRGAVAKQVAPDCGITSGGAPAVANVVGGQRPSLPVGSQVIHGTATMTEIVTAILRTDRDNDRAIVDRTGLTGTFDVDLWWVPARSGNIAADAADVMSLGTALQQQLGLKLEPRREPRDIVVIDAAEMPALD